MKFQGYNCGECAFYKKGICELKEITVGASKVACKDFEV